MFGRPAFGLRRLAAEAARSNARSNAGRITSEVRERDQKLLEMRAADPMIAVLEAFPVAAIKTGMLLSKAHIVAVTEILMAHRDIPLVIDPVMISSTDNPAQSSAGSWHSRHFWGS